MTRAKLLDDISNVWRLTEFRHDYHAVLANLESQKDVESLIRREEQSFQNESPFERERFAQMISTFRDAMINYYVKDVEGLAAFYCNTFGFKETFRTPEKGPAIHIEVRLGDFALGLADVEAARSMHSLSLKPGPPRGEVAMWTDDVDEVYKTLTQKGIRCISTPHDFLGFPPLRAAWFEDPEGNIFQIVCKRKQAGQL